MKELRNSLVLAVFVKVTIFLIVIAAFFLLPFNNGMRQNNFLDPDYAKFSLGSAFMTWDSQHYLFLSDHGYHPYQESNRFYPLFPGIMHIASFPFHNSFWGGFIISNLVSILAVILLYFFTRKYFSEEIAWITTILFLAFPTSFYTSLIYSEGLFLFLVLCFFWFLYKKEFFIAGLFSLFLPFTRPVGIFIAVPFAIYILQYIYENMKIKKSDKRKLFLTCLHILWPFVGFSLLLLFYNAKTGYLFEPFLLDKMVVGKWDIWNLFKPSILIQNFFALPLVIHGFTNSIIDRVFFVGFLCSLPLVYKKTSKSLFFYFLLMGGVAFFGNFMSYTRYLLVAFPIFIALATLFVNPRYRFLFIPFLFLLIMLQTFFIILHSLNYWVA